MGFDAEKALDPLDWDFTKFVPNAKGTSPEPTTKEIDRFFRKQQALLTAFQRTKAAATKMELDKVEDLTPADALVELHRWAEMTVDDAIEAQLIELDALMSEDESDDVFSRMAKLVAEVTHNCPSQEQIMGLPHRIRSEFFSWFHRELSNPESSAAGSNLSLARLNGSSLFT